VGIFIFYKNVEIKLTTEAYSISSPSEELKARPYQCFMLSIYLLTNASLNNSWYSTHRIWLFIAPQNYIA